VIVRREINAIHNPIVKGAVAGCITYKWRVVVKKQMGELVL